MTTSTDIVNEAIQLIGDNQPPVTGVAPNFDSSAAGIAAAQLYAPCVAAVARQFGWDFARNSVALTTSGNAAPFPWSYEYLYPANGIEIWGLMPSSLTDPNDPLPTNYAIANVIVNSTQTKVIHTNLVNAWAVYNNNPDENTWDALFHQAVVRLLASAMAMAIGGRPDTAQLMLESGSAFESLGESRLG